MLTSLVCTASLAASPWALAQKTGDQGVQPLVVWHTFIADTDEEQLFLQAVDEFDAIRIDIDIEVVRVPYLQLLQQFVTASQGGEAPDVVRLNNTDLGKIGNVSVNGAPLLEDLRAHLTPVERSRFDQRALESMRYEDSLFALPASQSSLSLIYNKQIFDNAGLPYPSDNWTLNDFLQTARKLTNNEIYGLAMPVKIYLWWIAFQTGFGGWIFDEEGNPTLDSPGSAEALQWVIDLELEHAVVSPGTGFDIEAVKTQFVQGRAAMTIDGPWNWMTYKEANLDLGQTLLPTLSKTGNPMSPILAYIGWSVSKQSPYKVAASDLVKWLTSDSVQKQFALQTYALPTSKNLDADQDIQADPNLAGFMRQSELATLAPTTQAMSIVFEPLNTAIELTYLGKMSPGQALIEANREMKNRMEQ